jgi:hypothetical protein
MTVSHSSTDSNSSYQCVLSQQLRRTDSYATHSYSHTVSAVMVLVRPLCYHTLYTMRCAVTNCMRAHMLVFSSMCLYVRYLISSECLWQVHDHNTVAVTCCSDA